MEGMVYFGARIPNWDGVLGMQRQQDCVAAVFTLLLIAFFRLV